MTGLENCFDLLVLQVVPLAGLLVVVQFEAVLEFLEERTAHFAFEYDVELLNCELVAVLFKLLHLLVDISVLDSNTTKQKTA